MAIQLEKVVETFYENLEKGKITGKKCTKCGAVCPKIPTFLEQC